MHLISRPDGYTTHQIVYINPVPFIPPPKTLHDKKDTTLLEMAMKAFLKQRLYGELHNFNLTNAHKKDYLSISKGPETQRTKFSASLTNMKQEKHQISRKNRNKNYSALDQTSFTCLNKQSKQGEYQNGSIRQMTFLNKVKEGRYSSNRSSLDLKNHSNNNPLNQKASGRSCSQNFSQNTNLNSRKLTVQDKSDDFIGNSFISAIEYQQPHNPLSNRQKVLNILKLPEITVKRQKNDKNQAHREVQKKYKLTQKKQSEVSCKISDQFWCLISKAKSSKPNKKKQTNLQNSSLVYNQSNLGVKTKARIFQQNLTNRSQNEYLSGQSKFASIPKNNDNIFLNKEVFQEIMTRSKLSISLFTSVILNFFEIPAKIHDKMKKQDLQALLSQAFSMHDRGWAVAIFRFLDINHDGQINSSDLFKIFNYLDETKVKLEQIQKEQTILDTNSLSSKRDVSNVKKQEITQNQSRQKTQNSQYTVPSKLQKDLATSNSKKSSSIRKKTVQNQLPQEVYPFSKTITSNNLNNLDKIQNQIRKFNKFVVQKHHQHKKISENANPEVQTANDEGIETKIDVQTIYLEEALLRNQELKYTDLNLILSHLSNDNKATKKKVIEIDHKKLNIKLSSTYVQTFGATDHNEGTRVNREYIQTLKEYLKKENQQTRTSSNLGEKKTLPSLKYAEFYEQKMHIPLKTLLFSLMHAEITYLN